MSIYYLYQISYVQTNGATFVKFRQAVLKLALKARYHLNAGACTDEIKICWLIACNGIINLFGIFKATLNKTPMTKKDIRTLSTKKNAMI